MLPEAFHQVFAQEDIERGFERRCWLKNSKMAVGAWSSLICE